MKYILIICYVVSPFFIQVHSFDLEIDFFGNRKSLRNKVNIQARKLYLEKFVTLVKIIILLIIYLKIKEPKE